MTAKGDLFTRLQYVNAAVSLPTLIDNGIAISEHNGVANLLRKGLGIVAFNILEDFIKDKSVESLSSLSNSGIPFNNLSDNLQESAISGALNALTYRSSLLKKDGGDWKTLIQDEALKIHSTKNGNYELSKFSLVYGGPNIGSSEVTDLLRAFGIKRGWAIMKEVSDKIGGGLPDLGQTFINISLRRHNAAHTAAYQYNYQELLNIKHEILTIAAALDILLTARCRQVSSDLLKKLDDHEISEGLNFKFLEERSGIYRETSTIGGGSRKNWTSLPNAINTLKPGLASRKEFLIVLNSSRRIEDWYS